MAFACLNHAENGLKTGITGSRQIITLPALSALKYVGCRTDWCLKLLQYRLAELSTGLAE